MHTEIVQDVASSTYSTGQRYIDIHRHLVEQIWAVPTSWVTVPASKDHQVSFAIYFLMLCHSWAERSSLKLQNITGYSNKRKPTSISTTGWRPKTNTWTTNPCNDCKVCAHLCSVEISEWFPAVAKAKSRTKWCCARGVVAFPSPIVCCGIRGFWARLGE